MSSIKWKSIRLIRKSGSDPNYCYGICSNPDHVKERKDLTNDQLEPNRDQLKDVLSIDMSHQTVDSDLLKKIHNLCPNVECFIIVETVFEQGSFTEFVRFFALNLTDITISDTLKIIGSESDLRCLWKNCTNLEEVKIILKDYNREKSSLFAKTFDEFPKNVISLYIEDDTLEDCAPGCGCKEGVNIEEAPNQGLYPQTILNQILENVSKRANKLNFLRLESEQCPNQFNQCLDHISKFKELLSPNLTFGSKYDHLFGNLFLRKVNCVENFKELSKIESLTMRFGKNTIGQVLKESRRFVFKSNVRTLRLINMQFGKSDVRKLMNNFKNVNSLQLIDCYFNDCKSIKLIANSTQLRKLFYRYNQNNPLFQEHHLTAFECIRRKRPDLIWDVKSFVLPLDTFNEESD